MWLMRQRNHNETINAWTCEKWSAFQTQAVYDKHVKEVHDWIKAITINWSISIWEQSISQVTNNVYMRTQNISSIGYKLEKGGKGIFSIEKASYIFHKSIKNWKSYNCDIRILLHIL